MELPSVELLHFALVVLLNDTDNAEGCVTVAEELAWHPLESVTVRVYDPAERLLMLDVVALLLQLYE